MTGPWLLTELLGWGLLVLVLWLFLRPFFSVWKSARNARKRGKKRTRCVACGLFEEVPVSEEARVSCRVCGGKMIRGRSRKLG